MTAASLRTGPQGLEKLCTRCQCWLGRAHFTARARPGGSLRSWCRACERAQKAERKVELAEADDDFEQQPVHRLVSAVEPLPQLLHGWIPI